MFSVINQVLDVRFVFHFDYDYTKRNVGLQNVIVLN